MTIDGELDRALAELGTDPVGVVLAGHLRTAIELAEDPPQAQAAVEGMVNAYARASERGRTEVLALLLRRR